MVEELANSSPGNANPHNDLPQITGKVLKEYGLAGSFQ
jgi:hypothetical protein